MTLNARLDIVIGLVLMYLTLSLACTVLKDMTASVTCAIRGSSRSVRMRHPPEENIPTKGKSWI